MERVTALFNDKSAADAAITRLRSMGIADAKISIVSKHEGETDAENMMKQDVGEGATRGLAVGASAGALFGLAAALIPGVGPFITAGALAASLGAAGGGAVAGAIVGGTVGSLAGAFAQAGYEKDEAEYYGQQVHGGAYLVAVDAANASEAQQVREVLNSNRASFYNRDSMGTTGMGSTGSSSRV
jgi:hypothetical protein